MFVGHIAVAFAARPAVPRVRLPVLIAAVQFLDILWPLFIVLGVEHARITPGFTAFSYLELYDFPYSHSLLFSLGWSLLFAAPWFAQRRMRDAWVVAGCVFSHFVLDFVSHAPDMPLWPGNPARFGLGLWNSVPLTLMVEGAMFVASIVIYLRRTRPTRAFGTWGFWVLIAILSAGWLSGPFAAPPPDIRAVALSALIAIPILLALAWRVDAARVVTVKTP